MPKNTPSRIIDNQRPRGAMFLGGSGTSGGVVDHGALLGLGDNDHPQYVLTTTTLEAGNGLTGGGALSAGPLTFAVGAGNLITVAADSVAVANGTGTYQFIGTGAGTTSAWHNVSELAGDGLTHTTALNVGVSGLGLSVGADAVTLTSSSNPGAAASILASDAAGALALTKLRTPLIDTASGNLVLQPASSVVALPSAVAVQTSNYASQLTGWRATYAGEADFRYLFVDEMHAKSFIADLEQALAGGQIICKSVAMVASAFTVPAASGTATLRVRDLPSAANMAAFVSGDIVRLRTFSRASGSLTIADAWGVVTSYADGTGGDEGTQTWTFTRSAAPNAGGVSAGTVIQPDSLVLDYGTTGNGYYEVNAIDGAYGLNSPYARIATWTTHPATGTALRAQFGNLRGVYGYSGTEFGVAMGSATGANVTVDATNGVRLRQGTTNTIVLAPSGSSYFAGVMSIDTGGEIRQGSGTLGSNYTGLRIWVDTAIGRIGGYNNNTLQWWAGTDGKLYAGNGYVGLNRDGVQIDRTTWTYTDAIPEPGYGSNPDLSPNAETALRFRDQAATFYRTGSPFQYSYPGNTIMRIYASSKHVIPTGSMGDWAHYMDGIIELPAITEAGDPAVYTRYLRLIAPSILLTGTVVTSSSLSVTGEINVRQHTTMEQWSLDCADGTALTMPNTYVFQFSDASVFSGLIIVTNTTDGGTGMFTCGGGQVVEVADGNNVYSKTKDTATSTNLYYDAGSNEYRMQNNTGGSRTYNIFSIRTRASS